MKAAPKQVTGTPQRHAQITNASGFRKLAFGTDTVPGPMVGAPLRSGHTIDRGSVKRRHYDPGVYPGSMIAPHPGVMGWNDGGDANAPQPQQRVHPDLMYSSPGSKAQEAAEAQKHIGNVPRGTVGRK